MNLVYQYTDSELNTTMLHLALLTKNEDMPCECKAFLLGAIITIRRELQRRELKEFNSGNTPKDAA